MIWLVLTAAAVTVLVAVLGFALAGMAALTDPDLSVNESDRLSAGR